MRIGFGAGTSEIYDLLARGRARRRSRSPRGRAALPRLAGGPTQDEIKELEHEADRIVSELLSLTNSLFVTPFDRDDLITLAFAVDDVADAAENASELLGLYGVETPTRQALELCGLLVGRPSSSRRCSASLKGMRGSSRRRSARSRRSRTRPTTSPAPRARASSRTTASTR